MEKSGNFVPTPQEAERRWNSGLTRLDKEVIPHELVGQNANYEVVQQPKNAAYPRGGEVWYSDDYLSRINRAYPFNEVAGSRREGIVARNQNDLNHFTMGLPLRNSEGEEILKNILFTSAHAQLWQPKVIDVSGLKDTRIKTAKEYLDTIAKANIPNKGVRFSIAAAQWAGLVLPTAHENKVMVIPSQRFIEYCILQNK